MLLAAGTLVLGMMAVVADLAAWEEPAAAVRAVVKTAAEVAATAAGSTVPLLNSAIQAADGWRCSPSFILWCPHHTVVCGIRGDTGGSYMC